MAFALTFQIAAGDPTLVSTFQEPEGQEGRRRTHPLPLKTVSSTCISLTRTQAYGHHTDARETDKYGLCSGEKCAQLNVRLIWEQSEEWIFDEPRAVFDTDPFWLETQIPLPLLTSIPHSERNGNQTLEESRVHSSFLNATSFTQPSYVLPFAYPFMNHPRTSCIGMVFTLPHSYFYKFTFPQ